MTGRYVEVVPLRAAAHASDLWACIGGAGDAELWQYMGDGPYLSRGEFDAAMRLKEQSGDQKFHAIVKRGSGRAAGYAAYLRDEPAQRVIEVGNIVFSPELQRTPEATEAMYLMARHVFEELGYRRYEWKCNALNEPSRRAAERFGFTYEGTFRQHMIVKGVNRDTAWFSLLDSEWPERRREFERWLDPANFDSDGRQKTRLTQER